jgi:hypothetical protein
MAVQMSAFTASPFVWLLDPTGAYQFCLRTDSLGNLIACRASARNAQTDLGRTGPRFCTPTHGTISRSKA